LQVRAAAEALCAVPWVTVERTMAGVDPNTPADRLRGRCFDGALTACREAVWFQAVVQKELKACTKRGSMWELKR
jgi:hypothetical protein